MPATALLEPPAARTGRATTSPPDPPAADAAELCGRVQAGRAALDALVKQFTPMVFKIVNNLLLPPTVERDDLVQHGMIALTRAAEKWRVGGSTFLTYAYTCVSNAVLRAVGQEKSKTTSLHRRPLEEGAGELLDLIPRPTGPSPRPRCGRTWRSCPRSTGRWSSCTSGWTGSLRPPARSPAGRG